VDADGSGTIDKSELKKFLTHAGTPADQVDALAEQASFAFFLRSQEILAHNLLLSLNR
jgi:hypothetical protein